MGFIPSFFFFFFFKVTNTCGTASAYYSVMSRDYYYFRTRSVVNKVHPTPDPLSALRGRGLGTRLDLLPLSLVPRYPKAAGRAQKIGCLGTRLRGN